jgi:hypothetical protein
MEESITNQTLRYNGLFITLSEFIGKKPIKEESLETLEKVFNIPKEDAHETLYVIFTQSRYYSLLDEILKNEYKKISEHDYFKVAKELFDADGYALYLKEKTEKGI